MSKSKHVVEIRWGIVYDDDGEDQNLNTYRFDTREELNAFMEGVEAGIGWSRYTLIRDSREEQDPDEPLVFSER
jgi:hypothetical protein